MIEDATKTSNQTSLRPARLEGARRGKGRFVQHVIHVHQEAMAQPSAALAIEIEDHLDTLDAGIPVCPACGWDEVTGTAGICTRCGEFVPGYERQEED